MSVSLKKIGLALSGGGLRASFFHIGLLAQMAEQGLLKSVSAISTVSGGSIIGALYYLHLKKLLESKPDQEIIDQDYIDIVLSIEKDFLQATEQNIRMQVLSDYRKNFSMRLSDYSRSDRIAEIYNELLYQTVIQNVGDPVEMRELKIYPPDGPEDFHPINHNTNRTNKVPILVINATALNTGRNWQFTASTMGEAPARAGAIDPDAKPIRLRRPDKHGYDEIVKRQQNFPLGHAVAASACVPGLFEPMSVSDLYVDQQAKENIVPQLVDGGVFDNQGVESLIDLECTHFIVSDATGQMGVINQPDTEALSVLLRVSSVLQNRVRSEGLLHLLDAQSDKNIIFIDMRKGLGRREISWNNEQGEPANADIVIAPTTDGFGVDAQVQEKISHIRTDLDAFTEVEAYSLMLDAYQMSKDDLSQFLHAEQLPEAGWQFKKIADFMQSPTEAYLTQLDISQAVFGKALRVYVWLWVPIVLLLLVVGYVFRDQIIDLIHAPFSIYGLLSVLLLWLATVIAPKLEKLFAVFRYLRPYAVLTKNFIKAVLLVLGTVFVRFYLKFINPLYLSQGRVDKLKK